MPVIKIIDCLNDKVILRGKLLQQNILATGNDARAENYLKENGEMQVLSSGGGILQNGGEAFVWKLRFLQRTDLWE